MFCSRCKISLTDDTAYSYRDVLFCLPCLDEGCVTVDWDRQQKQERSDSELAFIEDVDVYGDTSVGEANREIFEDRIVQYRKSVQGRLW